MTYQVRSSVQSLPVIGVNQNGPGTPFVISKEFDTSGRVTWVRSPRGYITHFVYDVGTGAVIRRIDDVATAQTPGAPAGWSTPTGGGLNLVTDYEIDRFGRIVRELGPVHQVQLAGDSHTTPVRQVLFTVYNDAEREVRSARGYAVVPAVENDGYTFSTVGSVTITRTATNVTGTVAEVVESVRVDNNAPLTGSENFSDRSRWRKWSLTTSDQWGKILYSQVYYKIPDTGSGSPENNYVMTQYGYDSMDRLVFLKDETGTITRTVYDTRGLVIQTWVGTNDAGATAAFPKPPGAPASNNMVLVSENIYDDGESGGNGYLTKVTRKVGDDSGLDREEYRKYNYRGQLEEVRSNDGTRDVLAVYGYDNQGRVIEMVRYRDLAEDGHFLGRTLTHYDEQGRVYRTDSYGADDATGILTANPLTSRRWYDGSGNLIKERGPNSEAATKYIYDGVERNLARYVVLEGSHSGSGGDSSSSSGGSTSYGFSSSSSDSSDSSSSSGSSSSSSNGSSSSDSSSSSGSGSSSSGSSSSSSSDSSSSGSHSTSNSSSPSSSGGSDSGSSGSGGGSGSSSSWASGSSGSSSADPVAPVCCCDEDSDAFTEVFPGTGQQMCADPAPCGEGAHSPNPIRYATGELLYSVVDLDWKGFGFRWGQSRSYSNRLSSEGSGLNGYRWLSKEMSYVAMNQGPSNNLISVVSGTASTLWVDPLAGANLSMFGSKKQYIPRPEAGRIEIFEPDGSKKIYYDYSPTVPVALQGKVRSLVNRNGDEMLVDYFGDGRLHQASWSSGVRSASFDYDYHTTGPGKTGRLWTITQLLDGVGTQRVVYDYYATGDLKTAVIEEWYGSGPGWVEIRRTFYRYYGPSDAGGFNHGLKMVVGPDGCRRMSGAGITDPTVLSDEALLPYSDFFYAYGEKQRVVMEKVRGGSREITYDYLERSQQPLFGETNSWAIKTTETRPDGNQFVVYSNRAGKPILHILRDVSNDSEWYGYREYNPSCRTTLIATSAAVESVTEPVSADEPLEVVIKASSGLVETFGYVSETNPTAGGYLRDRSVRPGNNQAASSMQISYDYDVHGSSAGAKGVFPVTSSRVYNKDGTSSVTSSQFEFYGGGSVGSAAGGGWSVAPNDISEDRVFLQDLTQYDAAGNVVLGSRSERFHDTDGKGILLGPDAPLGRPKGRRTYIGYWPDPIGRTRVTADFGTNGGSVYTRQADAIAPVASDTVLVSGNKFADDGDANGKVDAMGIETRWKSDAMGRRTQVVENYVLGGSGDGVNRTTLYAYHSNSRLKEMTVVNSVTGDQVTAWNYGVSPDDGSAVASNALVREKVMPDMGSYSYRYNRQGQVVGHEDPNSTVHEYAFDKFGRLVEDVVTLAAGSAIDPAIRRITNSYTAKGAVSKVTSYQGTGNSVANQVEFRYTPWGQVAQDWQEHSGAVDVRRGLKVSYDYRNNLVQPNDVNLLSVTFPSGRKATCVYGVVDGDNERLCRIEGLRVEGEATNYVSYQYCGLDRFVDVQYVQPGIGLSYIDPGNTNSGDAGDPYTGWDRFGRTQDMRWLKSGSVLERVKYGYNRGSQRTWRESLPTAAANEDEYYHYDGLYQLIGRERGELNVNRTAIGGTPTRREEFDYDPIGNWRGYEVWQNGSQTLDQGRAHNTSNLLTQIDGSSSLLAHDAAGNMTQCPPPESGSWSGSYLLKWDAWNRLVRVGNPNGTTVAEYSYDGLARRTKKTVSGVVTHFYYNQLWRPVEERQGSAGTYAPVTALYDWGLRYRDDLVRSVTTSHPPGSSGSSSSSSGLQPVSSSSNSSDSSSGPVSLVTYALHDYYSVTAITDEFGNVLERYGYSGFGDVRYMTPNYVDRVSSLYGWNLLYKAQFRDDETGYYNYGYRYYVPLLGRWLNRDPIGEVGGINLYGFVMNNGVNGTDLLGLSVWGFSGIRIGFWQSTDNYVSEGLRSHEIDTVEDEEAFRSDKSLFVDLLVFPESQLDKEAKEKANDAVDQGEFCCKNKKTSIIIFMVAPKIFPQNLPNNSCCDVAYVVYHGKGDIVPEQSILNGWGDDWTGKNLSIWQVVLPSAGHGFPRDLVLEFSDNKNINGDKSGGKTNLAENIKKYSEMKDEVMLCHSQGCNIAVEVLKKACNK